MQASKTENRGKAGPFYWLSAAKPKTSSEIVNEARDALVNEARDALRTVKTQRPFTPTDEQRKLFGSQSSLCPQNRPSSVFSLDTFSSDSSESRPHSGVRLSPLAHKPVLVISEKNHEAASVFLPTPPADAAEVRKVSSAWKGLFRITSPKDLFSAKVVPLDQNEVKLNFEEPTMMVNDLDRSNNNCLAEQKLYTSFNDESRQVICNEHTSRSGSGESMEGTVKFSLQLQGERSVNSDGRFADEEQQFPCNQMKEPGKMSSQPRTSGWKRRVTGLKDETRINGWEEEDFFWHTKILPILHELEQIEDNIEHLCLACTKLYQTLDEGNMLGKRFKRRNDLLKILYKLVDIDSDLLSLKLAKIILAMKVDGKNLLSVCKLAFKICRNKKNYFIIQNDTLLDYLLQVLWDEDLQTNNEALIYCMAAIKFMSENAELRYKMVSKGAVEMFLELMKQINNIKEHDTYFSKLGHLLVQLAATLRILADCPTARRRLSDSAAIPELCVALEQRSSDQDLCLCIVRILSKLSTYSDFCAALADCSRCYILFLALLNKYQKQQDLVIRVIFILGNLTAKNDQSREQFFKEKESVNILTSVFQTYYDLDLNAPTGHRDRKGKKHLKHPSEAEDVLIKLIRVLANLSIHPKVGAALAAAHPVVGLLVGVLEYKSVEACEELVINAATAINNLSYYQVKNSAVQDKKLHIAEMLLKLLMSDNMDAVVEAVRVFGNLSQHHEIRDFIMQKKIYKFMIALLDSKNREVCFPACGVLLNLTVDENKRAFLMEEGGIGKLVDCLQDFGPADWQLSCLICKTLWNYSESMRSTASCFRGDTNTLLVLLTALLDEEVELECSLDRDIKDCQRVYWEREFKPVAEKLLDRIQSHHSSAESITPF
ncbi:armadillo repeat-containing protein 2 isoform X1 [Parus major]|uniref:armadillo repeat-containing protein 2 isoform X1 n=1 Tax=Parus major TaxID=9157 RepID=UPI0007711C4D|nr:armadillo repeat-containing protein 2 isoform X1 [Parus major]XP_015475992.1 armadillo repeat-containing protein 2 isoform X1 [Parus major]XP_015475995.1 armadillo repeat-containing protein 2 isoform X1 [Parus major]